MEQAAVLGMQNSMQLWGNTAPLSTRSRQELKMLLLLRHTLLLQQQLLSSQAISSRCWQAHCTGPQP